MGKEKTEYSGYLNIISVEDTNKNGVNIKREVMCKERGKRTNDVVSGLLIDEESSKTYFVRQYRTGTRPEDRYLIEAVAGTLEKGEDPKECFEREAMEEVGFKCDEVTYVGGMYVSPGVTKEYVYLYIGYGKRIEEGGGLEDENEDIEVIEIDLDGIEFCDVKDLKTKMLILSYLPKQINSIK